LDASYSGNEPIGRVSRAGIRKRPRRYGWNAEVMRIGPKKQNLADEIAPGHLRC
jgi:hypothetical protein